MKKDKRQRRLVQITFIEDFATSKAGDMQSCEPSLASNLISRKVAVLTSDKKEMPAEKIPAIKQPKKSKK